MARRADPKPLAALTEVLRVQRSGAELRAAIARDDRDAARAVEAMRKTSLLRSQADWTDHLARSGFSPEYAGSLATEVVACEGAFVAAVKMAETASVLYREREDARRAAEVRLEAAQSHLREARRAAARRREEKSIDALADRVTYERVTRR